MNKKILSIALISAMAIAPMMSVKAEEMFNIYGWQNWSYEFIDVENGRSDGRDRDYDRMSNNAANIGFRAERDTGIPGLRVGFQCEQFTYWSRLNQYTGWCNRNSKISLIHESMGEIMFGQWLLPFNEIVAGRVDPFYDAGSDSHTSIMGNIGSTGEGGTGLAALYYNGSFDNQSDFTNYYGALAFNRRQEGIVQYVWPNLGKAQDGAYTMGGSYEGFQFRFAITDGNATDQITNTEGTDPRVWSTGAAWQQNVGDAGQIWVAVAYEHHEDLSATAGIGGDPVARGDAASSGVVCGDSEDEGRRIAARYVHNWGEGMKTWISAMWEELEYDADNCSSTTGSGATAVTTPAQPIWGDLERDAWMISGKHEFGNGMDFRFSYMDADEYDCGSNAPTCVEDDTDAQAYNIGLYYTPVAGGTEFRVTYSEIDNDDRAGYDFGIGWGGAGAVTGGATGGQDVEMFAIGVVQYFD